MPYRQRKSPRKRDYDYRAAGAYFVTICTQNRLPLFGYVHRDLMCWNAAGGMAAAFWDAVPAQFPGVLLDSAIVMPNHTHAIIVLDAGGVSLSESVQWYKIRSTNAYIRGVKDHGWERFPGRLWQRSFHDHIIRSEASWEHIRYYIMTNPAQWTEDRFYASLR